MMNNSHSSHSSHNSHSFSTATIPTTQNTIRHSWRPFAALAATILCCIAAAAEDWPQFRGPHRDGISLETGLLTEWPAEGPPLLWQVSGLGQGYSSASVADGMVCVTGMTGENNEGVIAAFDLEGNVRWKTTYGPEWNDMQPGTRSTPTIDGDRIYELSGLGVLHCLDAATGAIQWSCDLPKKFGGTAPRCGFAEAPCIRKDTVLCTPGGNDAALAALNKHTGETVWTSVGFSDQSAYCSPILIERAGRCIAITITARYVAGLDVDTGKLLWKQPFDTNAEDPNHSVAPVCQGEYLYVTSGHGKGGQMFTLTPDGLACEPRWTDTALNTLQGGLIFVDGYVYGSNSLGKWVCLEARTGTVMYESAGVGMGSVIYADGMLYCFSEKGTLGLVHATPETHETISSFKLPKAKGPSWAHPSISNGRLFLRHGDALMVYSLKKH